jgi:hypothetical protein
MATRHDALAARSTIELPLPRRRPPLVVVGGIVGLVVALLAGVGVGSVAVAPGDTLGILANRLLGLDLARTW